MCTLEKHAPLKEKFVRANNAPFMNKELSKAIMKRSNLRNVYRKSPTEENHTAFKRQRNLCVKLSRKSKKDYYSNLDISKVTDNKLFWNNVKPLFSDKQKVRQKIILVEDKNILSNAKEVADKMNDFFVNAVSKLNIEDPFLENQDEELRGRSKFMGIRGREMGNYRLKISDDPVVPGAPNKS